VQQFQQVHVQRHDRWDDGISQFINDIRNEWIVRVRQQDVDNRPDRR
jgi:hypothetical protein